MSSRFNAILSHHRLSKSVVAEQADLFVAQLTRIDHGLLNPTFKTKAKLVTAINALAQTEYTVEDVFPVVWHYRVTRDGSDPHRIWPLPFANEDDIVPNHEPLIENALVQ